MKCLVPLAIIALISGCAFKQSERKLEAAVLSQQASSPLIRNIVSFSATTPGIRQSDDPIETSGSTTLYKDAMTNQFQSPFPLVLPAIAPDTLTIEARIMDDTVPIILRGEIRRGDHMVREIPAAAFQIEESHSIKFVLTEMKQYFAADTQAEVTLRLLSVNDHGQATPFVSLSLSTPPSKLAITPYLPIESFEKKMKTSIPDARRHVVTSYGSEAHLVGIFEVKNNETAPIEITIPDKLAHALDSVNLSIQVSTSECSHSISKTPTTKQIASELWLRALQTGSQAAHIAPGEVGHIGVYAMTAGALTPGEDQTSPQVVPTRCMAHCQRGAEGDWSDIGKWGWDCYYCGTAANNMAEPCFGCMRTHREWCRWQDWRNWKDTATVSTGIQHSFNLTPTADHDDASSLITTKFLNQSVEGRMRQLLTETVSITR